MPSIMKTLREEALRELLDEFHRLPEDDEQRVAIAADIRALSEKAYLEDLPPQTEH